MSFDFTVKTDKNPVEVVNDLEMSLKDESFGVLWSFNVKEKLEEKGLGYDDDYYILEVCNPKDAKHVLELTKMTGYFLPCKVVVYTHNGETFVGMPKPTSLMEHVDNPEVRTAANDVEQRLITCIENAVK
ncbi:DUF302 domain-containing protein [Alteribacter aurantiacus]|uniref:DUF302 domain-containing protein n=1 Tax=Alteribacter aurantiacus TaxID=254410 RepID=UPI000402DF4D|nr:DUF302 domain-containing protein [Alteribacter aurantiacus]